MCVYSQIDENCDNYDTDNEQRWWFQSFLYIAPSPVVYSSVWLSKKKKHYKNVIKIVNMLPTFRLQNRICFFFQIYLRKKTLRDVSKLSLTINHLNISLEKKEKVFWSFHILKLNPCFIIMKCLQRVLGIHF